VGSTPKGVSFTAVQGTASRADRLVHALGEGGVLLTGVRSRGGYYNNVKGCEGNVKGGGCEVWKGK